MGASQLRRHEGTLVRVPSRLGSWRKTGWGEDRLVEEGLQGLKKQNDRGQCCLPAKKALTGLTRDCAKVESVR